MTFTSDGEPPDLAELTSGLFVKSKTGSSIVFEDGGQLSAVIQYVSDFFKARKYTVSIQTELGRLLQRANNEGELIRKIKQRRPSLKTFSKPKFRRKLLSYQQKALKHALGVIHAANFSVPGSGKTQVALAVFESLREQKIVNGILVIGPPSSFVPWDDEFKAAFGRPPKCVRLVGKPNRRTAILRNLDDVELILCSYQMAYREQENLEYALRQRQYLLVLDESHHIKNFDIGPWGGAVLALAPFAQRRMILTGTPVPHSLRDIWAQFTFLWPSKSLLGTRSQFEQQLSDASGQTEPLARELKPFFYRTKRSDLRLPDPVFSFPLISHRKLPKRQRLIIQLLELRTIQDVKDRGLEKEDIGIVRAWRKARIIRMLQAATNPALLSLASTEVGDAGEPLSTDPMLAKLLKNYSKSETPAKVAWTINKVRELIKRNKKVVIWTSFIGNIQLLSRLLADLHPLLAYGAIPPYDEDVYPGFESRERNIRQFKLDPQCNVLLANPAACAESISLHQYCQHAIYLDRTFNCGQFLQSMDRINRVGMPKGRRAHYYIPIVQSAIEQLLDQRLTSRQQILYKLMDDDMPVLGYAEDWSLLEREDDLDIIFNELVQELQVRADKKPYRAAKKTR